MFALHKIERDVKASIGKVLGSQHVALVQHSPRGNLTARGHHFGGSGVAVSVRANDAPAVGGAAHSVAAARADAARR